MERHDHRRLVITVGAIAAVFGAGTVGFHQILDESWHAAFYRTIITATLTGLDSAPRGVGAQLLTLALALSGVAIFGYLATRVVEGVAREIAGDARRAKRMHTLIERLHHHFIICGYGRVGRRAAAEFKTSGIPFVVLDFSPQAIALARETDVPFVEGNPSEDDDLTRTGIERAAGIVASSGSDAENLYITPSARARRPDLTTVARASDAEAERKLRVAGPGSCSPTPRPEPRWRSSRRNRRSPRSSSSRPRTRGPICASRSST